MRCEPPATRGVAGWAALAAIALLLGFYGVVFHAILTPRMDEDYRRTFVTQEFGAYPPSKVFGGRNGLAYEPGTRVTLDTDEARLYLARFDWVWLEPPAPSLKGFEGRIFLHLPADARDPAAAWRLRLSFVCALPAELAPTVTVAVNGRDLGTVACSTATGDVVFDAAVPPGLLGASTYDAITVRREPATLAERVKTRLGLRARALGLAWFEIVEE